MTFFYNLLIVFTTLWGYNKFKDFFNEDYEI